MIMVTIDLKTAEILLKLANLGAREMGFSDTTEEEAEAAIEKLEEEILKQ